MNPGEYEAMFAAEDRHWWYVGLRREILRAVHRFTSTSPRSSAGRWLDAGCGTGGLLAHLPSRASTNGTDAGEARWWPVGMDVAWDGLRFGCARRLPRLLQGSVTELPFHDRTFDLITSIDVLYHARVQDDRAVREMARVLKPGGCAIVQVPAFEWLRSEHDAAIWTKHRYTRREVDALVRRAGLVVRASYYRNSALFPLLALLRLAKRSRAQAADAVSDVRPLPRWINALLTWMLFIEAMLPLWVRRWWVGLSVFCVAQRPHTG